MTSNSGTSGTGTAIAVVLNPASKRGRSADRMVVLDAELRKRGVQPEVLHSESAEHASELARTAAQTCEVVVALGGDGMVRAVAEGLAGTAGTLGIVPGGSGNDMARLLGIPHELDVCADILAGGTDRRIDAISIGDRLVIGNVSLGIDTPIHHYAESVRDRIPGRLVYGYGTVRALPHYRAVEATITIDGTAHDFTGYSVAVANSGRYGGGLKIAPQAALDDGLLDIVLLKKPGLWELVRFGHSLTRGAVFDGANVEYLTGREVSITTADPVELFGDGDVIGHTPATLRVRPGCLSVRVPRT